MQPSDFIRKWEKSELKESAAAQSHFVDLCHLLDVPTPTDADAVGDTYCFEKGATKSTGGNGFADVWKKGCFGWEYKGPKANLDAAHAQLQRYAVALENPPLLIVSDTKRIIIRTNWTNSVSETHTVELNDLLDAGKRDLLRHCFLSPEALKPKKTRDDLTRDAADRFTALAHRLRARGHGPEEVAHFVNRLVFCMFAEDVDLLPNKLFQKAMERSLREPDRAQKYLSDLFAAMQTGGEFGLDDIPWFNGGLFDSADALPLTRDDVEAAVAAAKLNWADIDPSILGTLFERGLDPSKRSQLGAHYTDRDKILMIVRPVIIDPLEAEWAQVKARIAEDMEKSRAAKSPGAQTQAYNRAVKAHSDFIEKLANFRVLDPACGSGNFLYLSLKALKDIEHKANVEAEALGLPRGFPRVGPEAVKGIEINPYAAELARVSIWIGEIQWMRANGFEASRDPILKSLNNIECRDALIHFDEASSDWVEATWPVADAIVGNPPFLGGKSMKGVLGNEITDTIRKVYGDRISAFSDLVCYWFEKSRAMVANGSTIRCGLVATKAIAKNVNLPVLVRLSSSTKIFNAWQNEPWTVNGAAVRVSLVCFGAEQSTLSNSQLNGNAVARINPNLTSGLNTTRVARLAENIGSVFIGVQLSGPLSVKRATAEEWMRSPVNPNGRLNSGILSAYVSTDDIVGRPTEEFLIDYPAGLGEAAASLFEKPFEYLRQAAYDPFRNGEFVDFPAYRKSTPGQNAAWWEPHRSRPGMRKSISSVGEYLATAETTEHRVFRFLPSSTVPDKSLYAFPYAGMVGFGILQSYFHETWCTYFGNRIGAGNQRRYNASFVYLTFPFPEGLTPNIPAADYAGDPRAQAIAAAAERLNTLRENWLNPADLVTRVPEVVPGYPDRILPVDERAADILKKRTLTNLYNERPAWLDHAHRDLDRAVAAAYGWGADFEAGLLTDEEILKRLFELNQARAAAQG
ncbi:MAG: class I SAM-dependent DNA methyltransferase [Hyphomonas sp.]|uniref:class I SAM-dependent DNA methyltransferase n=1 Tax=Hyphomonas sp. TaxID=87 RepID=UPI001DFE0FD9|nr:DNA methyltransferase [Hyphomonas sp.]MBA4227830.1 class I SAM-dependent DNA methyltransferase [Hyphomonas sp.]